MQFAAPLGTGAGVSAGGVANAAEVRSKQSSMGSALASRSDSAGAARMSCQSLAGAIAKPLQRRYAALLPTLPMLSGSAVPGI